MNKSPGDNGSKMAKLQQQYSLCDLITVISSHYKHNEQN